MNKYKYNITFERRGVDGRRYGNDYVTVEASSFDMAVKKFKGQYGDSEIIAICRL